MVKSIIQIIIWILLLTFMITFDNSPNTKSTKNKYLLYFNKIILRRFRICSYFLLILLFILIIINMLLSFIEFEILISLLYCVEIPCLVYYIYLRRKKIEIIGDKIRIYLFFSSQFVEKKILDIKRIIIKNKDKIILYFDEKRVLYVDYQMNNFSKFYESLIQNNLINK